MSSMPKAWARWATSEPARPEPDDAEDLAVELDALPLRALPAAGDERRVGLGDVACLGEQERHRLLGHREDVRSRRVHHHDPALGGRRDVHVVQADAGPAHHLERGARGQYLGSDLGRRADDECVRPADRLEELLGGEPLLDVDLVTRVARAGRARSARSSPSPVPVPLRWSPCSPRLDLSTVVPRRSRGSVLRLGEEVGQPGHALGEVVVSHRVGHAEVARRAERLSGHHRHLRLV